MKHSSILESQNVEEGSKEAEFDIFVDDQAVPETNFEEFEHNITSPPQVVSTKQPVFPFLIDDQVIEIEENTPEKP